MLQKPDIFTCYQQQYYSLMEDFAFAYFNHILDARAVAQWDGDEPGSQLVSIETDADTQEASISVYINENFGEFLALVRLLPSRTQELLLSYFALHRTQSSLGPLFHQTQTIVSFDLRMATKVLACLIINNGDPSREQMAAVFEAAHIEEQKLFASSYASGHVSKDTVSVSLSQVCSEFAECRNFAKVAVEHGLHRPSVRRAMRAASELLLKEDQPGSAQAMGAYLFSLVDKANPIGVGMTKRFREKEGDVSRVDPPQVGEFRVQIENREDLVDQIFSPKANI